ncbi:MAG: AMP-binding protein [Paracoccaceae bacterium]|nr:AMP-binding protein [Paracoccaceae bacterium]MDG1018409.1 AMP-binding protein [Paracoccaceae bacterium]MDG1699183.1 AMP-binding protein [Paracoccaceae bacterium]
MLNAPASKTPLPEARFRWHADAQLILPDGTCLDEPQHHFSAAVEAHPICRFFDLLNHQSMPLICAAGRVEAVLGANANSEFCAMSGGTTGAPKVIQRRCASWIATFQLHARQFAQQTPLRYATLGDLQHSLTLYGAIEALHIGAIYHPLGGVSPRRQLSELQSAGVNVLYATPTQIRLLLNVKRQNTGLEALRHVMLGGGALDQETRAQLKRCAPAAEITEFFGTSEASFICASDRTTPLGSVGRPYPGVALAIRDAQGAPCPSASAGDIWLRSPYVFSKYRSGADPDVIWRDDWLSIGEIGYQDSQGYLYLKGRRARAFQVADQTVYPEVIEAKLSQHTGIEAAVVFACPDAKRGAVIVAVVAAGSGALPKDLQAWASHHLPLRARPAKYVLKPLAQWPVLNSGKPDLQALKRLCIEAV